MRHMVLFLTAAWLLAGCASIAPSLREETRQPAGFVAPAAETPESTPGNPGYPSPVSAFGAEISHNGYWRLLPENDVVPLPDGSAALASYLVRDCDPDVPTEELTYSQCRARIMLFQTGVNTPLETVRDLRFMVEDVDVLSELNAPERGAAASFSYAEGEMRGLVWGILTDAENPASGIVIAGEWPAGPRENLMQMQFSEIARGVRLTEAACGVISADDLEIIEQP